MKIDHSQCSYCNRKKCLQGDLSQAPEFCPSINHAELLAEAKKNLREETNLKMAQDVARTWKEYGKLTRVEETIQYARNRGYQKLGIAFCVGLSEEAEKFTNILFNERFDVVSVCCMCGAMSSDDIDLPDADKIIPGYRQPMCNPIGQAAILDAEGVDLHIILGLCVGDDTLFIKHAKAPVTVLAVKDRVLAHNPLGALYTSKHIYTRLNTHRPKEQRLEIIKSVKMSKKTKISEIDQNTTQIILESISDGVFTVDHNWKITSFNRAAEDITGISRKEAIGRHCWEVFRSNMCESDCALKKTMKQNKSFISTSTYIINNQQKRIPIIVSTSPLINKIKVT